MILAIVRNRGYVQLRRGLFEHVQDGSMTYGEAFLYMAILANADPATGVWISSAGMLSSYYGIPHRTCRDWLTKLENKHYLRRFMVQGKHTQYPILVHKFQCTEGAMKGKRLNAWESTSYQDLKYEGCHDGAGEGAMTVPQSTREGEKKRNNSIPQAVLEDIYLEYPRHVGKADALKAIKKAIREIAPSRDVDWLLERTRAFARQRKGQDEKFTPHPEKWFNGGRYDDEGLDGSAVAPLVWVDADGNQLGGNAAA